MSKPSAMASSLNNIQYNAIRFLLY